MSNVPIYRIVKTKWQDSAFDGEGARRFGGRWNSKGNQCIYVAGSESLAILEILVHLESDAILKTYTLIKSTIAQSQIMRLEKLPPNWRLNPAPSETALIGDQWLKSQQSLALKIPSAIVPREFNYLINPNHPEMNALMNNMEAFELSVDPRLLKL
jgi:RES domain-containing protein